LTASLALRPAKQVPHQMCGFCEGGHGQAPGKCCDDHGRGKGTYYVPSRLNPGRGNGHAVPGEGLSTLARPWTCLRRPERGLLQSGMHTASAIAAPIPGVR